jgi:hypothetical protein
MTSRATPLAQSPALIGRALPASDGGGRDPIDLAVERAWNATAQPVRLKVIANRHYWDARAAMKRRGC